MDSKGLDSYPKSLRYMMYSLFRTVSTIGTMYVSAARARIEFAPLAPSSVKQSSLSPSFFLSWSLSRFENCTPSCEYAMHARPRRPS